MLIKFLLLKNRHYGLGSQAEDIQLVLELNFDPTGDISCCSMKAKLKNMF